MAEGPVPFDRFDFDSCEEWKAYLSRIDLHASLDPAAALQRAKRKWYTRTYGPCDTATASSSSTQTNSSSSASYQSQPSSTAGQEAHTRQRSSAGGSSSQSSNGSAPSAMPSAASMQSKREMALKIGERLSKWPRAQQVWAGSVGLFVTAFYPLCLLIALGIVLPYDWQPSFIPMALQTCQSLLLVMAVAMFGVGVYVNMGIPSLDQFVIVRLFSNTNFQFFIVCLLALGTSSFVLPLLYAIHMQAMPWMRFCMCQCPNGCRACTLAVPPLHAQLLIGQAVLTACLIPIHGISQILMLFVYYEFLTQRAVISADVREITLGFHNRILGQLHRCPAVVAGVYHRVAQFVASGYRDRQRAVHMVNQR